MASPYSAGAAVAVSDGLLAMPVLRPAPVLEVERLNAAPELFEALAQNRPGYLKALLYPNGDSGRQ